MGDDLQVEQFSSNQPLTVLPHDTAEKSLRNGVVGLLLSRLRLRFTRPAVCLWSPTRPHLGLECLLDPVASGRISTHEEIKDAAEDAADTSLCGS